MLATTERPRDDNIIVWHLLVDHPPVCTEDCDFHANACAESDEEGIHVSGSAEDVPLDTDLPGGRWCRACLEAAKVTTTWLMTAG